MHEFPVRVTCIDLMVQSSKLFPQCRDHNAGSLTRLDLELETFAGMRASDLTNNYTVLRFCELTSGFTTGNRRERRSVEELGQTRKKE